MSPIRNPFVDYSLNMAAVTLRTAAIVLFLAGPTAAPATPAERALAVELEVALGDLRRLETPGLPAAHVEGLLARLEGALGLIPWLLERAGRSDDAAALAGWSGRALDETARAGLTRQLTDLAARTRFDLAERAEVPQPPAAIAEAGALHEAYCAGCHDYAETGDPDLALPARDLRAMAHEGTGAEFLARLTLGIKGDETIAFRSPVTDRQLLALKQYYETSTLE